MVAILAQLVGGYSIAQVAIFVVIVCAIVALAWVAMRQFGVSPPGWVVQVFWIIVVAIVVVWAIRFMASL